MTDEKRVGAIMRLLPEQLRDKLQWDHSQFMESSTVMRKWLTEKTKQSTRGNYDPAKRDLHSLEGEDHEDPELEAELHALGNVSAGELLVYTKKSDQKKNGMPPRKAPGGAPGSSPAAPAGTREAPPRDARDVRCGNCGDKGNLSRECKKHKRTSRTGFASIVVSPGINPDIAPSPELAVSRT